MKLNPYILFDAGGTLIFPDFSWLAGFLKDHGHNVDEGEIMRRFSEIGHSIDLGFEEGRNVLESEEFENGYFGMLLSPFASAAELGGLIGDVKARDRDVHLWNQTFPWVLEALETLKGRGYSMSVVSNSDGRVEEALKSAGISKYMDRIYDSYIVKSEKPDRVIFETALGELSLEPEKTVFVGDMFYIDVLGANRVGMPAVHLDPFSLYEKWPGSRIPRVDSLPGLLEKEDIGSGNFFPFSK